MSAEIYFSICIPSFNKGERVYQLVCDYLEQFDDRVEVVVSDDCSTDNTHQLLSTIKNSRFKYVFNKERIGYPNMIHTMLHATGKYSLLVGDKDRIVADTEAMDELQKMCQSYPEANIFICNYMGEEGYLLNIDLPEIREYYKKGTMGCADFLIKNSAYSSAIIIKNSALREIYNLEIIDFKSLIWKLYPQSYVSFLLSESGDAVAVKQSQYIFRELCNREPNGLFGQVLKEKTLPYFTLESRYEQAKEWIKIIRQSRYDNHTKYKMCVDERSEIAETTYRYWWMLHKSSSFGESGLYS